MKSRKGKYKGFTSVFSQLHSPANVEEYLDFSWPSCLH